MVIWENKFISAQTPDVQLKYCWPQKSSPLVCLYTYLNFLVPSGPTGDSQRTRKSGRRTSERPPAHGKHLQTGGVLWKQKWVNLLGGGRRDGEYKVEGRRLSWELYRPGGSATISGDNEDLRIGECASLLHTWILSQDISHTARTSLQISVH